MEINRNANPLISIIMPAYNCELYVEEAINSVLSQSYETWELIIIDDGSKDNTINLIKKNIERDSRIRFIKNEKNIGVSATRNKGISLALGQWIAFLDSDDIWENTKLEKQTKLAFEKKAEFIFSGSSFINEKGISYAGNFNVPVYVDYKKLRKHNVISCSSVLIKRDILKNFKMENDNLHEDYLLWLKILKSGISAHSVNEPLLVYRISKNSKSGNKAKSIKMTYGVFRSLGINSVISAYYTTNHLIRAAKKHKNIRVV